MITNKIYDFFYFNKIEKKLNENENFKKLPT